MIRRTLWVMVTALFVLGALLQPVPPARGVERLVVQEGAASTLATPIKALPAKPSVLLDTFNSGATLDGPAKQAVFTIAIPHRITLIQTYHWNSGRGATAGTVSLQDESGRTLGPWRCTGSRGQGGVLCFWECHPEAVVTPGSYRVVVSPTETWSHNAASGSRGFVRVEGVPADLASPPGATNGAKTDLRVRRSRTAQTVTFRDRLLVTLPPDLLKSDRVVTVAEVPEEQQLIGDGDLYFMPIGAFSVTMGDQHEFEDEITLSFRYTASDLNPNYSPEEQILAHRWDETRQLWSPVPCTVLPSEQLVQVRTKHLSLFSASISALGLAKAAAAVGGVAAVGYLGHYAYEKVWLDVYRSPNFVVYYAKGDVNGTASKVTDAKWWPSGRQSQVYTAKHPRYIQDVSTFLEKALASYQAAGFVPPPTPIEVKINSALIQYQANPAGYEHWHGRIHVNTAMAYAPDRVKQVTAHELFHAIQANDRTVAKWWEESTAEYASCAVAWDLRSQMGGGSRYDIYPRLLGPPMAHTGAAASGLGDIEYDKGYFVSHLVSKGGSFAGAWRVVAADRGDTAGELRPLDRYLRASGWSLGQAYRGFASYFLFSPSSPIAGTDPSTDCADALVVIAAPAKSGPAAPPVAKEFALPAGLTTRLLAVKAPCPASEPSRKVVVELLARSSDVCADVHLLRSNARSAGSPASLASLANPGDSKAVEVRTDDVIYVVVTNTSLTEEGSARIAVGDHSVVLSISPSAVKDRLGKLSHTLTATARSIPLSVKKLSYKWDFGDRAAPFTVTALPRTGASSLKAAHTYAKGGKYAVRVELHDVTTGSPKLLARASASVEISQAGQLAVLPSSGEAGRATSLSAQGTGLPKQTSYLWDFGDGSQAARTPSPSVRHTFAAAGQYRISLKALDASSKPIAQAAGLASITGPAQPAPAPAKPGDASKHLSVVTAAGADQRTVLCDLAGSVQHFVTKKMLNYTDPPFEIGLHDKGTQVIDLKAIVFGPAEYRLYKVKPPKTYMDYMVDKSIGTTLVETLSVD